MKTARGRALALRKEAGKSPAVFGALADKELIALAIKLAPGLRAHCTDESGPPPADEDIACGLLIRAASALMVKTCPSYEVLSEAVAVSQRSLARRTMEILGEGRPYGSLHS